MFGPCFVNQYFDPFCYAIILMEKRVLLYLSSWLFVTVGVL